MTYVCDHETEPPRKWNITQRKFSPRNCSVIDFVATGLGDQKITTDTTNILIRALSKRKKASRQVQHTTPNQRDRKGKR